MLDRAQTLPAALDAATERCPEHVFLRCDGGDTTVGELQMGSYKVATALASWGLERGDRVAVMMGNASPVVSLWFGILRVGCIEVPVHSAYKGPLLEQILTESGARVLFCDSEFIPRLADLILPDLERIVVRGEAEGAGPRDVEMVGLAEALASIRRFHPARCDRLT